MIKRIFAVLSIALAITAGAYAAGSLSLVGVGGAGVLPNTSLAYQTAGNNATSQTTYTFAAQAIGTAATDRTVIVAVYMSGSNGSTATALTVGGIGCTNQYASQATGPSFTSNGTNGAGAFPYPTARTNVSLWTCPVPTGTTATLAYNCTTAGCARTIYSIWASYGLSIGVNSTSISGANPGTTSATTNITGGFIIACQGSFTSTGASSMVWTGASERNDQAVSNANLSCSDTTTTGNPTITVTRTGSFASDVGMFAAAFH